MMQALVQILPVDKPTANGRVYSREVVEKAIAKLGSGELPVVTLAVWQESAGRPLPTDTLGRASRLRIDDTSHLVADVAIFDDIAPALKHGFEFTSAGYGKVQKKIVKEFTFTAVAISPRSAVPA